MARLRGDGLGVGMAMGTAAVVRLRSGIPFAPEPPERIAQLMARRRPFETPEVILIADEYRTALALANALPWAKVVGIAAERAEPDAPAPSIPVVVGVPNLLETIEDDSLLLVDATHGVLLPDPSGLAIAQYQAEFSNLAPKRRLYLDDTHLPAQTLDGVTLTVLAHVETAEEVAEALAAGADALFLPLNTFLLPDNGEEMQARRHLLALAEQAAGKPLVLADDYALPPMAVLEAAARADLTLAEPPRADLEGLGLMEMQGELEAAEAECAEQERFCSQPRLAAALASLPVESGDEASSAFIETLAAKGATRLFLTFAESSLDEGLLPALDSLIVAAGTHLLPVMVAAHRHQFDPFGNTGLENTLETSVQSLVGAGASGLIVLPEQVAYVKEMVRNLNISECREALWKL